MLALGLGKLFQLYIEFVDRVLSNAVAFCQGANLLLQSICPGNTNTGPVKELDGLFIILPECDGAKPLLQKNRETGYAVGASGKDIL